MDHVVNLGKYRFMGVTTNEIVRVTFLAWLLNVLSYHIDRLLQEL